MYVITTDVTMLHVENIQKLGTDTAQMQIAACYSMLPLRSCPNAEAHVAVLRE